MSTLTPSQTRVASLPFPTHAPALRSGARGDPGDGRGGGGKAWGYGDGVEVAGLALSPAPPGCSDPLVREWGRSDSPGGQARDPLLLDASVATATLPGWEQEREARGLDHTHAKCINVAGRV